MGEITVSDDSGPVNATVAYEDAQGNPANPADTPTWSSSDESVATVEASSDGLSATVTVGSGGGGAGEGSAALGAAAVISVVAHDDDGEEVRSRGDDHRAALGRHRDRRDRVRGLRRRAAARSARAPAASAPTARRRRGPSQAPEGEEPQVNPLR